METFSPDFAQYWLAGPQIAADEPLASVFGEEPPSALQRDALEALAERVNAARSIL